MSDHYDKWAASTTEGRLEPLPPERLAEIFAWTARYGPASCWTGTLGTAARMMRELLRERIRLAEEVERAR